jgi:flagellar hook protein FlgE
MGGVGATAAGTYQVQAHIYLPPNQPVAGPVSPIPAIGAEIVDLNMNFGTAGILGSGRRDGLIGDAEGSYQVINGVNTYVPNSHATYTQDGYTDGTLQGIQFDQTGKIVGTFTNGQNTVLGQVVLAQVDNPDGMNKVGNDYYTAGVNSGRTFVGLAGQNGFGTVQGDTLEGSNVDLTVELSNMIIAQRGFEVNARVISVTNSTLQTLTQLGQGG